MPLAIRTRWLGHDDDFDGVQKVHDVSTSRLGGLNVFFAYAVALASWFADGIIARLDLRVLDHGLAHLAFVLPLT
jgi:hypothetical protein